jgi:HEAT repeat protein
VPQLIRFEDIEEKEDRSWSPRMVEIIATPDVDNETADRVVSAITILSDPAVVQPLTRILEDKSLSTVVRERASRALSHCNCVQPSAEEKRSWQYSKEAILLMHAVRCADRSDSAFLLAVSANDDSPLLKHAIVAMTNGFEERQYQDLKIAALSHADNGVREAACLSLYADQPRAAEAGLLAAAQDNVENVSLAALKTLMHYCSRSNLLALHQIISDNSRSPEVLAAAREAYETVLGSFEFSLDFAFGTDQKRIEKYLRWLKPVQHLLRAKARVLPRPQAAPALSLQEQAARDSQRWKWTVAISESRIYSTFDEFDGSWAEKKELFNSINWFAIAPEKRGRVAKYLVSHVDPWVRENSVHPLCAWLDDDALLLLLDDTVPSVRRSAAYWCQFLPPDIFFVPGLMRALSCENSVGVQEIIESYAVHEDKNKLADKLVQMALEERESIAFACVKALAKLQDGHHLQKLLPLLERQPLAFALQMALLEALAGQGVSVKIPTEWRFVDDMHLQRCIALQG